MDPTSDPTRAPSSRRYGPRGVFVLMARGTLEEIRTLCASRPGVDGEIREIGRTLEAAGVEPDWDMVRKLLSIAEKAIRQCR